MQTNSRWHHRVYQSRTEITDSESDANCRAWLHVDEQYGYINLATAIVIVKLLSCTRLSCRVFSSLVPLV